MYGRLSLTARLTGANGSLSKSATAAPGWAATKAVSAGVGIARCCSSTMVNSPRLLFVQLESARW